jgi:hypothetical protein
MLKEQRLPSLANRLVVLVPSLDFDPAWLAKKITDMANNRVHQVIYLTALHNPDEEMSFSNRLRHLSAATHSNLIHVDMQIHYGESWSKALRNILREGDVLVYPEGYAMHRRGLWRRSLSSVLDQVIDTPLFQIPYQNHVHHNETPKKSNLLDINPNGHKE